MRVKHRNDARQADLSQCGTGPSKIIRQDRFQNCIVLSLRNHTAIQLLDRYRIMSAQAVKRRRAEEEGRRPKKKIRKFKKQAEYHSSSEDDDEDAAAPIRRDPGSLAIRSTLETQGEHLKTIESSSLPAQEQSIEEPDDGSMDEDIDETTINTALNTGPQDSEEESDAEDVDVGDLEELDEDDEPELDSEEDSDTSTTLSKARKKRNDPEAFATSISKILTTKLTTQKRSDPILSRSRTADEANKALADSRLETKARAAIRAEKKSLSERGRVKDVLGLDTAGVDTGAIQEEEKRLKKIAQRGVVKLFNAVRAAQVKAEEAQDQAKAEGVVGMKQREERVNEMSKEGFLDLISRGGKQLVEA